MTTKPVIDSNDLDLTVVPIQTDDFVIVDFEGKLFPGQVTAVSEREAKVSVLHKSGFNWKWPKCVDEISYEMTEIKQKIAKPLPGKRGIFFVPEIQNK